MKYNISVVILNYNTAYECINFIDSVYKLEQSTIKISFVIVDNNSQDDSIKILNETYLNNSNIFILKQSNNLGFSKGNNIGYSFAIKNLNPDFIIISNSDILIEQKDFFEKLITIYEESEYSVLGPDIFAIYRNWHQSPMLNINFEEKSVEADINRFERKLLELENKRIQGVKNTIEYSKNKEYVKNSIKNLFYTIFKKGYKREYQDVCLHGAFLIFSKKFFSRYNKCFEPEVFYYGEEELLLQKCKKNSDKIMYSPKLQVIHLTGVSTNKKYGKRNNIDREIFHYKNLLESKKVLLQEIIKNKEV